MKIFLLVIVVPIIIFGSLFAFSLYVGKDVFQSLQTVFERQDSTSEKKLKSKFAIISDTHSDNEFTQKAVEKAKSLGASYIIHTGDWTTVGTVEELSAQKKILDASGLPYWGIMGDHDRWQSQEKNFETVFGPVYQSFDKNGLHHILLDASDLDTGLGETQLTWFEKDLNSTKLPVLIFMHLPIYDPNSDRTITAKGGLSGEKTIEAQRFIKIISGKNIIGAFSGDHHLSESYTEPASGVKIVIVGAVTRERNLQTPRFDLVEVYTDNSFKVTEEVLQ